MRAGKLRHRVNVLLPSTTAGSRGSNRSGNPTTVLTNVPCAIETLSGVELELARQTFARATSKVTMRGRM